MIHRRPSLRLQGRDYTATGMYLVTICTANRACLFGNVRNGQIMLNNLGKIADQCWRELPNHFLFLGLDDFVVMPNHVHGILNFRFSPRKKTTECIGIEYPDPKPPCEGVACNAPTTNPDSCRGRACSTQTDVLRISSPFGPRPGSLGAVVRSYKSAVTKEWNIVRGMPGEGLWQRNFHDRIIRNEYALEEMRRYIRENPARWSEKAHT